MKENKATDTEDLIGIDASPILIDGNRSSYERAVERRQTRIKKEPKAKRSGRKPRLKVEKGKKPHIFIHYFDCNELQ